MKIQVFKVALKKKGMPAIQWPIFIQGDLTIAEARKRATKIAKSWKKEEEFDSYKFVF